MVKSVGNDEPIKINGQFVPHRRRIRPVHDDFESMLRGGYIRKYNTDHTGWESPHMLDLDPTGIPTPRWARAAMFQAGTDPTVAQMDFDNDGLGIATERGDVIGAWACFHIPDIFVEVDWMEGHEMSDEAVAKVLWAFARHGIALHIDRGEMGGGTSVPHKTPITFGENDPNHPTYLDFFDDYKNNPNPAQDTFADCKKCIFHYCMFVHKFWFNENGWSENFAGVADGSANLMIADEVVNDEAKVFMHELGHNLGLPDVSNTNTVMNDPAEGSSVLDYEQSEWIWIFANNGLARVIWDS